jgi:hypothetical protein
MFIEEQIVEGARMSVIVACRAADGTIVFGAERQLTGVDEQREMTKLSFYSFLDGKALIGMAASDVNLGFMRKVELFKALRGLNIDEDPIEGVQSRFTHGSEDVPNRVQILCAVASSTTATPKLMGISDNEVIDLSESKLCGIGSGDGAAIALLKQMDKRHESLRDTQIAVCASVWLAKQTDSLCGGQTDIWWLGPGSTEGKVEGEQIRSWDAYFGHSLPSVLREWAEATP